MAETPDTPDIPEGYGEDAPPTTLQEIVRRHRRRLERDAAVFEATDEAFETAQKHIAKRYWMRYKAFLDAGFTRDQAMDLLKELGIEDDE